jgi:hypothetical protein
VSLQFIERGKSNLALRGEMSNAVYSAVLKAANTLYAEHKKRLAGKVEKSCTHDNPLLSFKSSKDSTEESMLKKLTPLVELILKERQCLGFSPTLRGWCYVLEGLGVCDKGDFNTVQKRITQARKLGLLGMDITAEDETRIASGGSFVSPPLNELIASGLDDVVGRYSTCVIEQFTGLHFELVVEKLDLVGLLAPVTNYYRIPVTCSRGWSDMHSRVALLKRCAQYDMPSVVLMFGDHDPGGLNITDKFRKNLEDVLIASGLEAMPSLYCIRVGLNVADIERLGLVWIENLETSGGNDLGSIKHKQHMSTSVQSYIAMFGKRKCEANALLRNPKAAQQILIDAIARYIEEDDVTTYHDQRRLDAEVARKAISEIMVGIK